MSRSNAEPFQNDTFPALSMIQGLPCGDTEILAAAPGLRIQFHRSSYRSRWGRRPLFRLLTKKQSAWI